MSSKIDALVSVAEQQAWLKADSLFGAEEVRSPPLVGSAQYDDRLALLMSSSEWPAFAYFLRFYIEDGILRPFATQPAGNEVGWWNAVIGERASSVRINIWRQYVATFDFRFDRNDNILVNGEFYVDKMCVDEALATGAMVPDTVRIASTSLIGHDKELIGVFVRSAPLEEYEAFFDQKWFIQAIRVANLDLMHGGRLSLGRHKNHVPKLIDAIFAEPLNKLETERPAVNSPAPGSNLGGKDEGFNDLEVQVIVWRRQHTRNFTEPVLTRFGRRCAISGIGAVELLEACHIKTWIESSDQEKLDPNNGLCLAAHLHAAFDAHLIGVTPDGLLVISDRLAMEDRERLKLGEGCQLGIKAEQRPYLEYRFRRFLENQDRTIPRQGYA